jgi:hypothetical protein
VLEAAPVVEKVVITNGRGKSDAIIDTIVVVVIVAADEPVPLAEAAPQQVIVEQRVHLFARV